MTASEASSTGRDGFSDLLGIEYLKSVPGEAHGRVKVTDALRQPFGIVHGGVYASLAESVCSAATYAAVAARGMVAMGQSNDTAFLRPIDSGHVNAVARARHTGRTTWVWDVELTDDQGRLCALVRMSVAVRPRPEPPQSP
jgi:uncharacterized protein (TIGR00369 family)